MHFLDLFSGWSLLVTDETPNTSPELVEKAFYLWLQIFGGAPRVFFSDQGPEFMALKLEDLFRVRRVKFLRSPAGSVQICWSKRFQTDRHGFPHTSTSKNLFLHMAAHCASAGGARADNYNITASFSNTFI